MKLWQACKCIGRVKHHIAFNKTFIKWSHTFYMGIYLFVSIGELATYFISKTVLFDVCFIIVRFNKHATVAKRKNLWEYNDFVKYL